MTSSIPHYEADNSREALELLLKELDKLADPKLLSWIVDWAAKGCNQAIEQAENRLVRNTHFNREEETTKNRMRLQEYEAAASIIGRLRTLATMINAEDFSKQFSAYLKTRPKP